MTQARVVALAAACSLLLVVTPAVARPTRLDTLPAHLLPSIAGLLDPGELGYKPAFVDPFLVHGPNRAALVSIRHVFVRVKPVPLGPALSRVTRRNLRQRIRHVLPRYENIFQRVADDYHLSASLIAAQSYIESKWRPDARYHKAAGMMMLSRQTARVVGVHNRFSSVQSIRGGARYLDWLRAQIPASVPYPDRNLFALAAYNMGLAHLDDARELARRLGKNPNLWADLREVLPLLDKRRYYTTLPHGFAQGRLVVRYVERILRYQRMIAPRLD